MNLLIAILALAAPAADENCGKCGKEAFGTSIVWEDGPSEAARKAQAQEKLVFVLHVSGNFEDPAFT